MAHRHDSRVARGAVWPRPLHRRFVALLSGGVLLVALQSPVVAAMAVFDSLNYSQSVIAAVQLVNQVQLTLRDLAPMTQMGAALQVAKQLHSVLTQVETIASRMTGRRGLWTSAYPLDSVAALAAFRSSSNQLCRSVSQDALGSQSLIADATRLLNTLMALVDAIDILAGSVSGLQAVNTTLGSVAGHLAILQTLQAANNEAVLCQQWAQQVRREGMERLQRHLLRDWGVASGG